MHEKLGCWNSRKVKTQPSKEKSTQSIFLSKLFANAIVPRAREARVGWMRSVEGALWVPMKSHRSWEPISEHKVTADDSQLSVALLSPLHCKFYPPIRTTHSVRKNPSTSHSTLHRTGIQNVFVPWLTERLRTRTHIGPKRKSWCSVWSQ